MPDYPKLRLATIAKLINEKVPNHSAKIEKGWCNAPERGVSRRVSSGKGRWGHRLLVHNEKNELIIDHNGAQPYRSNSQVLEEIEKRWGRIWEDEQGVVVMPFKCELCGKDIVEGNVLVNSREFGERRIDYLQVGCKQCSSERPDLHNIWELRWFVSRPLHLLGWVLSNMMKNRGLVQLSDRAIEDFYGLLVVAHPELADSPDEILPAPFPSDES